mgnify:CR=1 FL=1
MVKEEALNEFLKGLRIVLSNASAYPKEHPYFVESLGIFKKKTEELFSFLNPAKIGVTPDSLSIEGKYFGKTALYVDLAALLHLRKIKSVEFRQGVSERELLDFLSAISTPLKDVLRKGGVRNILGEGECPHISIEELDYSELLHDTGDEVKDIWVYLLKSAVQNIDMRKVDTLTKNFERVVKRFKARDLYEDPELRQNLHNFLSFLKGAAKEKFLSCSKELLRVFLRNSDVSSAEELEKIKILFQDMTNDDLTNTLIDSISQDEDFNNLSFSVFTRLFDQDRHGQVAVDLEQKLRSSETLQNNPRVRKKVKEIFSLSDDSYILPVYRQALDWIYKDIETAPQGSLERDLLQAQYRFLLRNLLSGENDPKTLPLISERLLKELDSILKERDTAYLKSLSELMDKKSKEGAAQDPSLEEAQKRISAFVENMVFEKGNPGEMEAFMDTLTRSSLGLEYYLNMIFKEKRVNPYILRLMLKLFPGELDFFYENLEKAKSDMDLMVAVVKSLEKTDFPAALEPLKKIFGFSNIIVKEEVLNAMRGMVNQDADFLFPVLQEQNLSLRKKAFLILSRLDAERKRALEALFSLPSAFGRNNDLIMENISIVEEEGGASLKEAEVALTALSQRRFFWNGKVRKKAEEALKKTNAS